MIRYARGFLHDDFAVMAESAAQATVEQRRRGDHHLANVNELVAIGLTLLMSEQLEEHDALVTELAERYRAHGPPTCLQWALTQLGISASLAGQAPRCGAVLRGRGRRRRSRPHAHAEESAPGKIRIPAR